MTKVKDLVVDSGAFLRNSPLQDLGENIYTCEEVLAEVKSKWAIDRLQVLPYEIKLKEPDEEDLQFVIRFAKKTGDYFSLSKTDLKVMALAVCMERQRNGNIDHLKTAPSSTQIVSNVPAKQPGSKKGDTYGFNFKNKSKSNPNHKSEQEDTKANQEERGDVEATESSEPNEADVLNSAQSDSEQDDEEYEEPSEEENEENEENAEYESSYEEDDTAGDFNDYYTDLIKTKGDPAEQQAVPANGGENTDDEDDGEGDWITPSNIAQVKKQFDSLKLDEKSTTVEMNTACITGDFSMQNVLMQIGIKVLSVEKGLLIRQARQFVLRCIACFTITNNTSLLFCPSCGNLKTLKKVSVSVDEKGQKRIHLNPKRPITTRDLKLRIPRPRKGKYALNPILVADQHVPKFRQAKFAIQERKMVNESVLSDVGYLVRDNPFSMNDVYSRSSNYKTGNRVTTINKMVFNEGRKYATKKKRKRRN